MDQLQIGEITIHWLNGGITGFDGGAMFGVVPKPLWQKKYPANHYNQVPNVTDPMYFTYKNKHFLIDAGLGNGRLTEKQKRNYGLSAESSVISDLALLGVKPEEIDFVLMTHLHFDHVLGLTIYDSEKDIYHSQFKNAQIITSLIEWQEMQNPNIRSKATYWQENYLAIKDQIICYENHKEVIPGINLYHTGGHSAGHAVITIETNGECAIHMGDIFPTTAHQNVLWVTAYDDYPMDSIYKKQEIFAKWMDGKSWFLFYHDYFYRAIKFDAFGNRIEELKRE